MHEGGGGTGREGHQQEELREERCRGRRMLDIVGDTLHLNGGR